MARDKTGAILRAEAAKTIDAVVTGGRSLDDALAMAPEFLKPQDQAQFAHLCYGVIRSWWQLNEWQSALMKKPLRARDSVVRALLNAGLYQLSDTRVPDHAAVSMTVEASRILRQPKFSSLLNAVLRNFRRQELADKPAASEEARFNHPQWMIDGLRDDWPDHWQDILAANNERAPMWLRVNTARESAAEYLGKLDDDAAGTLDGIPSAICLGTPKNVLELPGFPDGAVSVQDGAAQLAAQWLDPQAGERVLDACSAPGGKTGHLLELCGGDLSLTAVDVSEKRLNSVRETLDRLGYSATLKLGDASKPEEWWDGELFDRILLDVPCSATGVIRRHPDIKLLRRPSDLESLAEVQQAVLAQAWRLLRPGGRLLYVTCSVWPAENERQVEQFLGASEDARENRVLPNNNINDLMLQKACGFQILPGTRGLDGFYFACLEKDL